VVVDLSQAEFIDSTVLDTLLEADRMARERGLTFTVQVGTPAIVQRVLEISGVLDRLSCADSRIDAIRAARQPASHNSRPSCRTSTPRTSTPNSPSSFAASRGDA
jgi:STAS domain